MANETSRLAKSGFHRDRSKGLIGGVCAGLAEYFYVKPSLLRLTFVLWSLANELGVAIYFVLWIILPEAGPSIPDVTESIRRNVAEIEADVVQWRHDFEDVLGGSPAPAAAQIRHVTSAGALVVLTGVVFLIDRLHLLSPFGLHQLGVIVWILIGIALGSRALHI